MKKCLETDLYTPVKELFEGMGYKVNAEVKGCDVTAYKDGDVIIIEMKSSFNLKLLYQGIERQSISRQVYLAVPRPRGFNTKDSRNMRRIMRRLGLGLIYVSINGGLETAEIIFMPDEEIASGTKKSTRKRSALIGEISSRKLETNMGGSRGVKLNTAYRERCVKIACIIEQRGVQSAKSLVHDFGCERDAYLIISRCPYNWFIRIGKGIYGLSADGREFLESGEFKTQVDYFRGLYKI